MPKKLSKKARAALLSEFAQYSSAIEFSKVQIRKLEGEGKPALALKEKRRLENLETAQKAIGAQL